LKEFYKILDDWVNIKVKIKDEDEALLSLSLMVKKAMSPCRNSKWRQEQGVNQVQGVEVW